MTSKNQLFKIIPSFELVKEVIKTFGLTDFNDNRNFSRRDLSILGTVEKIIELKPELEKCYLPCKSRTYLNDLNNKNVITVLRQIVRPHGFIVYSREKYIRGDKFIIYQLVPSEQRNYRPMAIDNNLDPFQQAIVRFD